MGLLAGACDDASNVAPPTQSDPGASAPTGDEQASPVELFEENRAWSRSEALAKLDDEKEGVRAAVRLVRLADVSPLIVPEPLPAEFAQRLSVVRLTDYGVWAVGYYDVANERALRCPILIDAKENVTLPAEGLDEELLVLHRSESAEVFPHVLMLPDQVWFVTSEADTATASGALVLKTSETVRFALGSRDGYPYVRLMLRGAGDDAGTEVAEYRWQPYELTFAGPLIDKLPFPPGGKFELDLELSTGLTPMGGELPAPQEIDDTPPRMKPDDDYPDWARGFADPARHARV